VLNRHAIVLFLGNAAMLLLHPPPLQAAAPIGGWFLLLLVGLLLDNGEARPRVQLGQALQLLGVVFLLVDVGLLARAGREVLPAVLAETGISLAAIGVLMEMRLPYRRLRLSVGVQALGDLVFLIAFGLAWPLRSVTPSTVGWVFIAIAGAVSGYAAISNGVLQLSRLRNPQAGWRFRVLGVESDALALKTPDGTARLPWSSVRALKRLDPRHLLLVLPSPLPGELSKAGLPLEELRESAEPPPPGTTVPPDAFGFILHEQEFGRPLDEAEKLLASHLGRP